MDAKARLGLSCDRNKNGLLFRRASSIQSTNLTLGHQCYAAVET